MRDRDWAAVGDLGIVVRPFSDGVSGVSHSEGLELRVPDVLRHSGLPLSELDQGMRRLGEILRENRDPKFQNVQVAIEYPDQKYGHPPPTPEEWTKPPMLVIRFVTEAWSVHNRTAPGSR